MIQLFIIFYLSLSKTRTNVKNIFINLFKEILFFLWVKKLKVFFLNKLSKLVVLSVLFQKKHFQAKKNFEKKKIW